MAAANSASGDTTASLDERDVRALTEYMAVLPEGDGTEMFTVVGQNGGTYTVDARRGRCSCPDNEHRGARCKHLRRVALATGARPVPDGVDGVDLQLGLHVDGTGEEERRPTRHEPADFGDGESTGVQKL